MIKRVLLSSVVGMTAMSGALFAHGAPSAAHAAKHYNIVLIAGIASDAFYITMNHGAQAEAKKLGVTVQFSGSPVAFSAATQLPFLNSTIARKPDFILIAPTDTVALQAPIQRAVNAHIPVILVDTTLKNPSIAVTTISSDNIAGGVKVADALAQATGKKGKIAIVSTSPGISTTDQRVQGFTKELKKYPKVTLISPAVTYTGDDQTRANTVTKSLVAAHKDLAGVFATNVVTGDGVTAAARELGLSGKLKLVEFDAEPAQVQAVKNGTIAALVAQDPYSIGEMGVRFAVQYLNGKHSFARHYGTGEAIITKANVNSPSIKNYLYSK